MFQNRFILILFLCLPVILKADYGVEIVTKREGPDCSIEMIIFLYGDLECVTDYNVTVLVEGDDVTPAPLRWSRFATSIPYSCRPLSILFCSREETPSELNHISYRTRSFHSLWSVKMERSS